MGIKISRDTETRLADEARKLGISVDDLLKRLLGPHEAATRPVEPIPQLPVWHLGDIGPVRRRQLYDDVD